MVAHTALIPYTEHMCYWIMLQASSQCTMHTYKYRTRVWALWWLSSPSMCFFNAPNKVPNHNIHRDIKLKVVMLAYHVLPKKLPNSGCFPHWRQLCYYYCHYTVTITTVTTVTTVTITTVTIITVNISTVTITTVTFTTVTITAIKITNTTITTITITIPIIRSHKNCQKILVTKNFSH